ncbi:MAG: hypothetical protein RL325_1801 [Planctomycetota bacterium]|jgi:hypothetical protein
MASPLHVSDLSLERRVNDARSMFQRVLVSWAGDVLELRRRNDLVPRWESSPTESDRQDDWGDEPMKHAA